MEKQLWEYCSVSIPKNALHLMTPEGIKKTSIPGGNNGMLKAIAQLGREGWEMTAASDYTIWFKRALK